MDHRKYMRILNLNEEEIASRRIFFAVTDEDLTRLASLRPLAEKLTDAIVEDFYALLLSHPETRKFFPDEATIRRVKRRPRRAPRSSVCSASSSWTSRSPSTRTSPRTSTPSGVTRPRSANCRRR